jgi:cytochrome P450
MSTGVEQDPAILDCPVAYPRPGEGYGLGGSPFRDERLGAWVVSEYADVDRVVRDGDTFSSANVLGPERAATFASVLARVQEDPRAATAMIYFQMVGFTDGEAHCRERSFFNRAFTPARVRSYEPVIRVLVEELTDALLDGGGGEFVEEFAMPLPVRVIASALGMPPEDFRDLKRWSDGFEGLITLEPTDQELEAFLSAAVEFTAYITPLIEPRRYESTGDIISAVAGPNEAGDRLGNEEILALIASLMVAGNETTTAALAGTMMYLVRKPDLQTQVRADPNMIPALVEEGLRLTAPAQALFRTATKDAEVGGVTVAAGEHVYMRFAAANRDESRFEQPLCPVLDRPDKRHLAFGRGPHVCPGAPLARAEMKIAFEMLLDRTKAIRLSDREDPVVAIGSAMTASVGKLYLEVSRS